MTAPDSRRPRDRSDPTPEGAGGGEPCNVDLCNLDGRILPVQAASVPVLDRGFLFGDSVYEAFRTRDGVPFAWQRHLRRLRASAAGIGMSIDVGDDELIGRLMATLAAAAHRRRSETRSGTRPETTPDVEQGVRMIVTRGDQRGALGLDPSSATGPCRVILLVHPFDPSRRGALARLALVRRAGAAESERRDPAVKSGNYLSNLLGHAAARSAGATDCVFHGGPHDEVTEAATANIYVVRDGVVTTPALSAGLLAGITRELLLEAATAAGRPILEGPVTADQLRHADEAFLTATSRDLAPVSHVDDRALSGGAPGPVTRGLQEVWAEAVAAQMAADRSALPDPGDSGPGDSQGTGRS